MMECMMGKDHWFWWITFNKLFQGIVCVFLNQATVIFLMRAKFHPFSLFFPQEFHESWSVQNLKHIDDRIKILYIIYTVPRIYSFHLISNHLSFGIDIKTIIITKELMKMLSIEPITTPYYIHFYF